MNLHFDLREKTNQVVGSEEGLCNNPQKKTSKQKTHPLLVSIHRATPILIWGTFWISP